jgi:Sulfatase
MMDSERKSQKFSARFIPTKQGTVGEHALDPDLEGILRHDGRHDRHQPHSRLRTTAKMLFTLLLFVLALVVQNGYGATLHGRSNPPNIVFILTDDQDLHLNSLSYMQSVQKNLAQEGTTFNRHFATVSLCCPSRVSLLTGKAAHNTNVTDIMPPYGM